jgi:hypothetical protein
VPHCSWFVENEGIITNGPRMYVGFYSLTYVKGIPANAVILDDIVEAAFGTTSRDLSRAYKASPSSFLRGLTSSIQNKILEGDGVVPVITGITSQFPEI